MTAGEYICEVISPIVPISLDQAEESTPPYAVYEISEMPSYAKDVLFKTTSVVAVYVVTETYAEVHDISMRIRDALVADTRCRARVDMMTPGYSDSVWVMKIDMSITQNN